MLRKRVQPDIFQLDTRHNALRIQLDEIIQNSYVE